jgi:hypothetical protein
VVGERTDVDQDQADDRTRLGPSRSHGPRAWPSCEAPRAWPDAQVEHAAALVVLVRPGSSVAWRRRVTDRANWSRRPPFSSGDAFSDPPAGVHTALPMHQEPRVVLEKPVSQRNRTGRRARPMPDDHQNGGRAKRRSARRSARHEITSLLGSPPCKSVREAIRNTQSAQRWFGAAIGGHDSQEGRAE